MPLRRRRVKPAAVCYRRSMQRLAPRFDLLGPLRDLAAPLVGVPIEEKLLARAAVVDGERFLEVGVGEGATFLALARANVTGQSHALDRDRARLARLRARLARGRADHGGVQLELADVRALPFADRRFELVIAVALMGELEERERGLALDELRRVLEVGGRLLLAHPTRGGAPLAERLARLHRPLELAPELLARFRDVSRMVYRRFGLAWEILRAVRG